MRAASLSLRLALQVSLMGASLVLLLAILEHWSLERGLDSIARIHLTGQLQRIEHSLSVTGLANPSLETRHMSDMLLEHRDLHLTILGMDADAPALLNAGSKSLDPGLRLFRATPQISFETWTDATGAELLTATRIMQLHTGQPVRVLLSYDLAVDEALLTANLRYILLVVPLLLALVGGGAWWIAQKGLAPLRQFIKVAAQVSTDDLSHRIATAGLPRELDELARGINVMLERLDDGVQQLAQFSDDLAHELRSPITNLLGKAQVTLARERSAEDYKAALESCTEELERLARIVSDMLFLAQVSQPAPHLPFEPILLEHEVAKMADIFGIAAEEKHIELSTSGAGRVLGDRLMIQRALSNLLSNAIRHCPEDGEISIRIEAAAGRVTLSIGNSGPGIAPQHLAYIFERFYRADACRSRAKGGTGLGLAIVRSIMVLHQGRVEATSKPGELTMFRLIFPDIAHGMERHMFNSGN
ncbi:heavy metal sensor histidine kinase [Azomonas macrocytogenes]|uniref:Sensor protein n=1 Tax=Azomonas macrocytogenes TaxID=69962 RepID=A0A839T5S3_AZOMA|nr:heavy metal sensor histidine kinase [Azomonas macrocytogenes]MBB3103836.1 two-component system heavy metal sensor histidine kinase CusS [Azomonas macrocytogenes]